MFYPNNREEKKLLKNGFFYIAGVDEAGRGAWAGPIVAGAVILNPRIKLKGVKDSKLLRAPDRRALFEQIVNTALAWSVGIIDHNIIDEIGLTKANELVMLEAIKNLTIEPEYVLADGLCLKNITTPYRNIIDGDYKITSIAAASIIAKVKRDQILDELDEYYPAYGFKQHKGYGTSHHHHMLMRHGICQIHRKTFEPIKFLLDEKDSRQ